MGEGSKKESSHIIHNPVTAVCGLATPLQQVPANSSIFHSGKRPATTHLMYDNVFVSSTTSPLFLPSSNVFYCPLPQTHVLFLSRLCLALQFDKAYAYSVRHMFGKEGKRTDYTPYSCMKVILSNPPSQGDYHGESYWARLLVLNAIGPPEARLYFCNEEN